MEQEQASICSVCGEPKSSGEIWFLLAERHWEDTLKILEWEDELASRRGMHLACCPGHARELVIHWMTEGNLDHLLAVGAIERRRRAGSSLPVFEEADTRGAREIGELSIDRESISRVLVENPDSLGVILEELCDALEEVAAGASTRLESADSLPSGWLRQA